MESEVDERALDLNARLRALAESFPSVTLGVSVYDFLSGRAWRFNGDRWFHAASLVKVPILAALFDEADRGRFTLECRLHVRNRFLSVIDGMPLRVDRERDADLDVHAAVGRTMRLRELARHMVVTSSNLATNLLLDLVGLDAIQAMLHRLGAEGLDVCRGVEDDRAFEQGTNNRITPDGAVGLLKTIVEGKSFSPESSTQMLNILHDQQFSGTIAPGLPDTIRAVARVAHKTGDISTASHDAGVVFLPGRPPYVLAILTESPGESRERLEVGVAASAAIYECVAAAGEGQLR